MNVASWNVRGLNKASHQREVINFIAENSVSFMCCLETKVKIDKSASISQKLTRSGLGHLTTIIILMGVFGLDGTLTYGKLGSYLLRISILLVVSCFLKNG